jgi:hypothetical protein
MNRSIRVQWQTPEAQSAGLLTVSCIAWLGLFRQPRTTAKSCDYIAMTQKQDAEYDMHENQQERRKLLKVVP